MRADTVAPLRVLMVTSEWPREQWGGTPTFIVRQVNFLRAAGVEVELFSFHGARHPWNYALAWADVRRKLSGGRHDLVHAQFGQSGLVVLPTPLPLVVTLRGDDLQGIVGPEGHYLAVGRVLHRLSRAVAHRADAVILVSHHMRDFLGPRLPAHVIPSGIDFDLFRCIPRDKARRRLGLPPGDRLVLFVGRPTEPRKRFTLARQAVAILNRFMPAELILGYGVPHSEVPWLMSACDVLVFTSMHEGSPNVVKEALACNLPVVSVPVADVPSRLAPVAGCEVCANDRADTIAAALKRVLRRGQRVEGREAVKELDERLLTGRLVDIYRSVVTARVRQNGGARPSGDR
jgi:teichuronic acid biosynthesis glycosyltransferase TuaC